MAKQDPSQEAFAYIKKQHPDAHGKVGLILGSGLKNITEDFCNSIRLPYSTIPNFPHSTVSGHTGELVLGQLGKVSIACMEGRFHFYEGLEGWQGIKTAIRTLKLLGCEIVIITNAAGSLHQEIGPGRLMMIEDHINLQPNNPLIGPNDHAYGPRFVSMENAYDRALRKHFKNCAHQLSIPLASGVYIAVAGPTFETPAEIQAFAQLGGDLIGMSTVPDVIIARHCGMRVAAISIISNLAVGLNDKTISHEKTLQVAEQSSGDLRKLLVSVMDKILL